MSATEVRSKVLSGVLTVGLRGVGIRVLGLVGNIVLARLLLPEDFGILALGYSVMAFGGLFSDGGLAAGLIRSRESPTRDQLGAVLGVQAGLTTLLAGGATIAVVVADLGLQWQVCAVMLWTLFLGTFKLPAFVLFERRLDYGSLAAAEVLETVAYTIASVALVAAGFGVWGVTAAAVLRPLVSVWILQRRAPMRVLRPRWKPGLVRPLLGYGLAFQASAAIVLVRDSGVNIGIARIGGIEVLGLWSLGTRIMLIPFLLFETLWRVSFPAVARLLESGADVQKDLQRALRSGTLLTGVLLVGVAGAAPALVPLVFGDQWAAVVPVLPIASLGLLVSGPVSAIGVSYFMAIGRVRVSIVAQAASILPWVILLPLLVPRLGVTGSALAWMTSCIVEVGVLSVALRRVGVPVLKAMIPSVVCAPAAAAPFYVLAERAPAGVITTAWSGLGAVLTFLLLTAVVARRDLREVIALGTRLRNGRRVERPQPEAVASGSVAGLAGGGGLPGTTSAGPDQTEHGDRTP